MKTNEELFSLLQVVIDNTTDGDVRRRAIAWNVELVTNREVDREKCYEFCTEQIALLENKEV